MSPLTNDDVETYSTDGVVCLRGVFDAGWIDTLNAGLDINIAEPSDNGRIWDRDDQGRTCLFDCRSWQRIEQYAEFVRSSPMAEIAAALMETDRVNFFYDAVFVRTPGNRFRTPFHQDEPYWSVEGFDTLSAWMPLVPVQAKSSLEFVRGSHRWPERFRQQDFGELTGDDRDHVIYDRDADVVPFPDIEGARDDYDIVSWAMEPGDVAIFNARIIHGGSGNLDPGEELRVFNTQWLGDDVRVRFRPEGMDPDHSATMIDLGLGDGDRIGTDVYPLFTF